MATPMDYGQLTSQLHKMICQDSDLVRWHLGYMKEMVRIDSRSFNVNEFEGDRKTPSDMKEILELAKDYLANIGFALIRINQPDPGPERAAPILMAELIADSAKPTILMYAHLDKQPYMDDGRFLKWGGISPTELWWNEEGTRAYGRGAADDLSGVVAIGMAVNAILQHLGFDPKNPSPETLSKMPCNIKVIFETEEECGSHSLIDQIIQNQDFFSGSDCVLITDVINPAQGVPGLTTSLRGIAQLEVLMKEKSGPQNIDAQTALYKTLSTLSKEDSALALKEISDADLTVTEEERHKLSLIPVSVESLREAVGLLPETRLTVPDDKVEIIIAQLRKSCANVRPGHRVAGSVLFGIAGARLTFKIKNNADRSGLRKLLNEAFEDWNILNLKLKLEEVGNSSGSMAVFDLIIQSATHDPHSGVHGGPFPVPEIELAQWVDRLIDADGKINLSGVEEFLVAPDNAPQVQLQSLHVDQDGQARTFSESGAKAVVEIRLAPGNDEVKAAEILKKRLLTNVPAGFELEFLEAKSVSPWITRIDHPAFPVIMEALEAGFNHKACLYGCGGSIPFVAKLMEALGGIPPLCIGPYDPASRMHEPGESLSLPDLLGCARSIAYFVFRVAEVFQKEKK